MRIALGEPLLRIWLRLCHRLDRRTRDQSDLGAARQAGEIRRILLVSCTALGDTLLSSPAFASIRLAYPLAHITLLGNEPYRVLFEGHPALDEFIAYDGSWRRFLPILARLRVLPYDLACILHGNEPQITPLAYLAGIRFIFKLPNQSRYAFLLSNPVPSKGWDDYGHGIEQRLEVATLAGGVSVSRTMTLVERAEDAAEVAALLQGKGIDGLRLIALQPGASTLSRRWAPDRFIALGKRLQQSFPDAALVVTGSPGEAPLCRRVAEGIGGRTWTSAGEVPLKLLPALFRRCSALVTGDTGPMHLAVAVSTPVIALFAVSDYRRSGPAYDLARHVVIQKWRTCDPCLSKRCPYAEPICMENISVDEVFSALAGVMNRSDSARVGA